MLIKQRYFGFNFIADADTGLTIPRTSAKSSHSIVDEIKRQNVPTAAAATTTDPLCQVILYETLMTHVTSLL